MPVQMTSTIPNLAKLTEAVVDLEQQTIAFENDPDLSDREAIISTLDAVRDLVKRIQYCDASMVQKVAKLIGFNEQVVVPGAVAERKWNGSRKGWQHDAVKGVVAERVIATHVDPETGALNAPTSQLIREALDCASINGWKTTKCKPLGIDVDRYCEKGDGKYNLVIRKSGGPGKPGDAEEGDADG